MHQRHISLTDNIITRFDKVLRTLTPGTKPLNRPSPVDSVRTDIDLSAKEIRHAAGLMRVNHTGEVCAQALYQGQALTAKLPNVRKEMEQAADDEVDHLAWCEQRLTNLQARPSLLNPLWFGMSFGIGATAGLISDKISLGFVAATEDQVCEHLKTHLVDLPENDEASRAIVQQMLEDEAEHAHAARRAGGVDFPTPIKKIMTATSTLMTRSSYHI